MFRAFSRSELAGHESGSGFRVRVKPEPGFSYSRLRVTYLSIQTDSLGRVLCTILVYCSKNPLRKTHLLHRVLPTRRKKWPRPPPDPCSGRPPPPAAPRRGWRPAPPNPPGLPPAPRPAGPFFLTGFSGESSFRSPSCSYRRVRGRGSNPKARGFKTLCQL